MEKVSKTLDRYFEWLDKQSDEGTDTQEPKEDTSSKKLKEEL